jgi:hypothetical protein
MLRDGYNTPQLAQTKSNAALPSDSKTQKQTKINREEHPSHPINPT